jgi:hypothetical protein
MSRARGGAWPNAAVVSAVPVLAHALALKAIAMTRAIVRAQLLRTVLCRPTWVAPAAPRSGVARSVFGAVVEAQGQRTVGPREPQIAHAVTVYVGSSVVGALLSHVNPLATATNITLVTNADPTLETLPVPGAVPAPQTLNRVTNHPLVPGIAYAAPCCCARSVSRAVARAVGFRAGGSLPPDVANAAPASYANAMPSAVVQLFACLNLSTV